MPGSIKRVEIKYNSDLFKLADEKMDLLLFLSQMKKNVWINAIQKDI